MSELIDCPACGRALIQIEIRWTFETQMTTSINLHTPHSGGVFYTQGGDTFPLAGGGERETEFVGYFPQCPSCKHSLADLPGWQFIVEIKDKKSGQSRVRMIRDPDYMKELL